MSGLASFPTPFHVRLLTPAAFEHSLLRRLDALLPVDAVGQATSGGCIAPQAEKIALTTMHFACPTICRFATADCFTLDAHRPHIDVSGHAKNQQLQKLSCREIALASMHVAHPQATCNKCGSDQLEVCQSASAFWRGSFWSLASPPAPQKRLRPPESGAHAEQWSPTVHAPKVTSWQQESMACAKQI